MSIKNYLEAKKDPSFKLDEDKFYDYPVMFTDHFGELREGFINDVIVNIHESTHTMNAIILTKDGSIFTIEKRCTAPVDCAIDWDLVHCAYSVL